MPRLQNRRGFALPMAILVIAILTAAVAAGFAATASESVVSNAQRAQERAYQLAEAGLQQFTVRRDEAGFCTGCVADPAIADSEYTRVQLNGGYADIVAYRVRNRIAGLSPALYFIRSRGVDTAARLSGTTTVFAERTVGVYATWNTTTIRPLGALTTLNGVSRVSATVSGNDGCTSSSAANLPYDLVIPSGSGTISVNFPYPTIDSTRSIDSLKIDLAIDWQSILDGGITPDYTVPPNAWPASYTSWPIIRVKNLDSLRANGQGIVIADGNFVLKRPYDWNGLILVGGRLLTSGSGSGTSVFRGAYVSGLNLTLAGAVNPAPGQTTDNDNLPSGSYDFYYNSCYLASAGLRFHQYLVMPIPGWTTSPRGSVTPSGASAPVHRRFHHDRTMHDVAHLATFC